MSSFRVLVRVALTIASSLLVAGVAPVVVAQTPPVTIETPHGQLKGAQAGSVRVFRGVPYAQPPTGAWRWKAPRPAERWDGVRDASAFGPPCVQPDRERSNAPVGSEDCLHVNVWTTAPPAARRPVLFYVHGGSFVFGSGAGPRTDGTRLAEHGVVVVTINHRLGIFGFLGHPDLSAESGKGSGNYGLLDVIEALRWVKSDIAAFGGDPDNVTIMGMSSGASALSMIMSSRLARGLFHKAFLQSPGAFRGMGMLRDAEAFGLGLSHTPTQLRALPSSEVQGLFRRMERQPLGGFQPLRPVVDGYVLERPEGVGFTQGLAPPVPVMISSAADEGSGFVATWTVKTVADFADYVRQEFGPDADEVLKAYAPTQVSQVPQALAQVFGDSQFGVGARGIARAMAPSGVYRSTFTRKAGGVRPAVHGSDTAYPFGNVPEAATDPIDRAVSEAMMNALVRFMHTGSPNGDGLPAWPRWTPTGNQEMEFGDAPRVRVRPDSPGVVTLATIMERRSAVWGRR